MKQLLCGVIVAALTAAVPAGSEAQTPNLQLSMKDGRVTIVARDVPLRTLFDEWAKVGQTLIVNADKLTGPRVTLQLVDTTERAALDILLRSAAGYIAAPRPGNRPGPSAYDRITILATATSPPPAATASASARTRYANPAAAAIATPATASDDHDAAAVIEAQEVAQPIPEPQSAVAPFPEIQPQIEAVQPRNFDRNGLMQNPQGQSIAPATPTGIPPGQPIPIRYPMFPRPPGA